MIVRSIYLSPTFVCLDDRISGRAVRAQLRMRIPIIIVTGFPDDTLRAQVENMGSAVLLPSRFGRGTAVTGSWRLFPAPAASA